MKIWAADYGYVTLTDEELDELGRLSAQQWKAAAEAKEAEAAAATARFEQYLERALRR